MKRKAAPKRRTLNAGRLNMPTQSAIVRWTDDGYTFEQAYVRAFNDANRLLHTAFESAMPQPERMAA